MPPPLGSKNLVLKLRSVKSIVIAPAKTGSLKISKTAVTDTAHKNKGIELKENVLLDRAHTTVVKKLIEPIIDLTPAKCSLKIAISTDTPE